MKSAEKAVKGEKVEKAAKKETAKPKRKKRNAGKGTAEEDTASVAAMTHWECALCDLKWSEAGTATT